VKYLLTCVLVLSLIAPGWAQSARPDRDSRRRPSRDARGSDRRAESPQLKTRDSGDGTLDARWNSPLLGRSVRCEVHRPRSTAGNHAVVVYLKNLPAPRFGTVDDTTLIREFIDQGMLVIEADYRSDPWAVAPRLLPEIDAWYSYLYASRDLAVDRDWIYVLPAGHTIERNVKVCDIPGREVRMDVIYPSGRCRPVPLMLQITSTKDPGKWINQRA
jgi:hypothetical protein